MRLFTLLALLLLVLFILDESSAEKRSKNKKGISKTRPNQKILKKTNELNFRRKGKQRRQRKLKKAKKFGGKKNISKNEKSDDSTINKG